jgi:hypothetical protein
VNQVNFYRFVVTIGLLFTLIAFSSCDTQPQMTKEEAKNAVEYYLSKYPSRFLELPDFFSPRYVSINPASTSLHYVGGGKWEFTTELTVTKHMLTPTLPDYSQGGYLLSVKGLFHERSHLIEITKKGTPLGF